MAFVPRLDAPSTDDKRWINKGYGGYNPCIPIYGGPSVLPNCFSGDTRIITKQDVVRLDSIVDDEVEVLSMNGDYRKAIGRCFGVQYLYEITFDNGQSFKCTANHRWLVMQNGKYIFKTTLNLTKYDIIPYVGGKDKNGNYYTHMISVYELDYADLVYCVEEPETHTMTLQGGILTGNCVGYAHGRFAEVMGENTCNLSTANAGEWWYYTQDGYERGNEPRLGAVVCWNKPGDAGHVAVVEQVNPDGSIVTSNSAYNSTRFYTQTLYPPDYTWSSYYHLQGFIYNPNTSGVLGNKIEGFIQAAKDLIGTEMKKLVGDTVSVSVQLVSKCAKSVPGLANEVIPIVTSPSTLPYRGITYGMGEFIEGPLFGNMKSPDVGDIILIRTSETRTYTEKYYCDKLAIVCEIHNSDIEAVHVNSLNKVASTTFKTSYKAICGYYRPDWSKVKNSAQATYGYAQIGKYYDSENTAEDATIREVGYLSGSYQPTTERSDIKLSVVNYTTLLAAFLDNLLVPCTISGNLGTNVLVDGIPDSKVKIVLEYIMSKGLNAACACGIAGNIYYESNFNTAAIGDHGTSFGICQWHYGRGDNMKRVAGSDWNNNLTGQLDYLWQELQGPYSGSVLSVLDATANTIDGVRRAADTFVRKFEIPANVDEESKRRQDKAIEYWNAITIQNTTTSTVPTTVTTNSILSGKSVEIPATIPQDGMSAIYTNYSYFYSRWSNSSVQRKVADLWSETGAKSNRNIAVINGYYLVAVSPIFGTNGDKLTVILDDGTSFNAIIADIKGSDATNTYGHVVAGGRVNIIEWEAVGNPNSTNIGQSIDLSGWNGRRVVKIINGGSIL
jgi:hypothetical protein